MRSKDQPTQYKYSNRLTSEKSPYLLQHAHNPVDWYPWGQEAFDAAVKTNRPIFLSVGYSTCHWCHVMERESFEDQKVASLMNEAFINIKVDREERPDIDSTYMLVCQMLSGSGGWPLTIIMTPDRKPFFADTYIPRESRFGHAGLLQLIPHISALWGKRRDELLSSANEIVASLFEVERASAKEELSEDALHAAFHSLASRFDETNGGFGAAPKFPTPHILLFLMRYWKRTRNSSALVMVEKTLQAMRMGGIFDQIGFGFHRYSVDATWLVPHFEKMLYDQALLIMAYAEAFQATGKREYRDTIKQIITYVLRDMTSPEGGFYSAEDADSEGEEGKFYLWTKEAIQIVLDGLEADLTVLAFNILPEGNFTEPTGGNPNAANIPHQRETWHEVSSRLRMPEPELTSRIESARKKLFAFRETRKHPDQDDKVLTDWNGLMIAALAKAAQVLDDPACLGAATRAADFLLANLRTVEGRLLHRYRAGEAAVPAFADDYAFLVWGLIELYEASFDVQYLRSALSLNRELLQHHWDSNSGGLYSTADDAEQVILRQKHVYDGATPSANSVHMLNLIRLARITGDSSLEDKATSIGRIFASTIVQSPSSYTQLLVALDFALGPSFEVVITGTDTADDTREMLAAIRTRFFPSAVVVFRPASQKSPDIDTLAPFVQFHSSLGGRATAYVCRSQGCQTPTTDVGEMLRQLAAG
ncbi:MAG TPA: thioredoxin domain-containing protein [Dehalococcoidia bacterium]|nr:thioredoxin domain-containing protein [Dehalococcoidia bacterium]